MVWLNRFSPSLSFRFLWSQSRAGLVRCSLIQIKIFKVMKHFFYKESEKPEGSVVREDDLITLLETLKAMQVNRGTALFPTKTGKKYVALLYLVF